MYNLLYDGSFAGFLTALKKKMHQPVLEICIRPNNGFEVDFYSQDIQIATQPVEAKHMLALLRQHFSPAEIQFMKRIIKQAKPGCEDLVCEYIISALNRKNHMTDNSEESAFPAAA